MRTLLAQVKQRQEEWDSLRRKVREALPRLVKVLVEDYGARRVTLFGSLLGSAPSESPDIDLLVEGLVPERRAEARDASSCWRLCRWTWCRWRSHVREIVERALEDGETLHAA